MITEDSVSDHNEKKPISEEVSPENLAANPVESEKKVSETVSEKSRRFCTNSCRRTKT
jgi:hypothetical protein